MPRRKKIQKKKISETAAKKRKNIRFEVSLVILIGILTFSTYLLLMSLNRSSGGGSSRAPAITNSRISSAGVKRPADYQLKDASIDFETRVPSQIGDWFYKIGYVKSPADETLADQYVQVFVPISGTDSNNFEDKNKNILTIRKYTKTEWDDLEKGCRKGNQFYCETAGKMIAEKNGSVYAYAISEDCPKIIETKCRLAEKIIGYFRLK